MDCYGLIDFDTGKSILFVPRMDNYVKIWMTVLTLEEYQAKYSAIDEVMYSD